MFDKVIIKGGACVGKDVFARYLVENHGFHQISFASPIYKIAKENFGMVSKDRPLIQVIGQKFREIDPDVWVKLAMNEAMKYPRVVISDCRQANEYMHAVANGFVPIEVVSDMSIRIQRAIERDGVEPDVSRWSHESEIGADGFRYPITITNNGTEEEYHGNIHAAVISGVYDQSVREILAPIQELCKQYKMY